MAVVKGTNLRLDPREVEEAIKEERKKWRVFRLQQVREQARQEAERVRGAVRRKHAHVMEAVRQEVLLKWNEEKENRVLHLQEEYDSCFKALGTAHKDAKDQPDANKLLAQNTAINRQKAVRRGKEARRANMEEETHNQSDKMRVMQLRTHALKKEKLRANRIAQLPTPAVFKPKKIVIPEPVPKVQLYEHGTLTTTNYVPKDIIVEKEIATTKPNAYKVAEAKEREQAAVKAKERAEIKENEKRVDKRGKAALQKEHLHRKYKKLIDQLDEAQRSHHLSAYLKGSDAGLFETEEMRLKKQATHQHNMETAAERVLQGKMTMASHEFSKESEETAEESDLKEISSESKRDDTLDTLSARERQFRALPEEIRETRNRIIERVIASDDSSFNGNERIQEKSKISDGADVRKAMETDKENLRKSNKTIEHSKLSQEVDHLTARDAVPLIKPRIEKEQDPTISRDTVPFIIPHIEKQTMPSDLLNIISNKASPSGLRKDAHSNDIHFTETVPVHLLASDRKYKRLPTEVVSKAVDELTLPKQVVLSAKDGHEVPTRGSSSVDSSSEGTVLPPSSDDIEIKIHLSGDSRDSPISSITSSHTPLYRTTKPELPIHVEGRGTRCPNESLHNVDSSTEYLSLPSHFSPGRFNLACQENLSKIQQQRLIIQKMLEGRPASEEHLWPITYMQEMSEEGKGRRPLSKREKFELKKKEILHHYLRKLLNAKDEEIFQMSASTVEGSAITISSLNALVESLNRPGDESTLPSLITPSDSSSVRISSPYPDIDEVPTKLTNSSELILSSKSESSSSNHQEIVGDSSQLITDINAVFPGHHSVQSLGRSHGVLAQDVEHDIAKSGDQVLGNPQTYDLEQRSLGFPLQDLNHKLIPHIHSMIHPPPGHSDMHHPHFISDHILPSKAYRSPIPSRKSLELSKQLSRVPEPPDIPSSSPSVSNTKSGEENLRPPRAHCSLSSPRKSLELTRQISKAPEPLDIPSSSPSVSDLTESRDANLQRELQILEQLQTLQRIKQTLILKKNALEKDGEQGYKPSQENKSVTEPADKSAQEIRSGQQGARISLTQRIGQAHSKSDLDEDLLSVISKCTSNSPQSDVIYDSKTVRPALVTSGAPSDERLRFRESSSQLSQSQTRYRTGRPELHKSSTFSAADLPSRRVISPNQSLMGTNKKHLLPEATVTSVKEASLHSQESLADTGFRPLIPEKSVGVNSTNFHLQTSLVNTDFRPFIPDKSRDLIGTNFHTQASLADTELRPIIPDKSSDLNRANETKIQSDVSNTQVEIIMDQQSGHQRCRESQPTLTSASQYTSQRVFEAGAPLEKGNSNGAPSQSDRSKEVLADELLDRHREDQTSLTSASQYISPRGSEISTTLEKKKSNGTPSHSSISKEVLPDVLLDKRLAEGLSYPQDITQKTSQESSPITSISRKNSSDSVTSIPDMGEILQRFGLTWAQSMIRKMDRTEEHSSSGN
ncbi:hypothetical protein SK128_008285 [Halocaridina rubra]|uniref:Uncharacterized protein n=1 Tax=Halocaridina rubra TaxID=373956 RepID=A0AAN8XUJ7_HALRR